MKGAPWFKFFPSDFMAGVAELTSEERGSYISLLCHQWTTGDLPGERMRLERLAGGPVSDAVAGKFVPAATEGRVFNVRLESHREEAQRRGNAGTAAAAKRWDKQTDATALRPHCADDATALRPDMQILDARGQMLEDRGEKAESEAKGGSKGGKAKKPKAEPVIAEIVCPEILPANIDAPEVRALIVEWLAMRKAVRKPATVRAVKEGIADLAKFGGVPEAIASLRASIIGNWTGLFAPKPDMVQAAPEAKRFDANGRELF